MGALADFIRREFGGAQPTPKIERERRLVAIPAIPAIPHGPNSENSGNSSAPGAEINPPSHPQLAPVAPLDERRAAVARLHEQMAAENEARREWWREPVEEGRLTIRSAATGETKVIKLEERRARR